MFHGSSLKIFSSKGISFLISAANYLCKVKGFIHLDPGKLLEKHPYLGIRKCQSYMSQFAGIRYDYKKRTSAKIIRAYISHFGRETCLLQGNTKTRNPASYRVINECLPKRVLQVGFETSTCDSHCPSSQHVTNSATRLQLS